MIVAIVQARMSSSRLPGKSMAELAGKPMIARVLERIAAARELDRVILATSTDSTDDTLADWAAQAGQPCYRGSLDDVLARYALCAAEENADVVVRLTGDNPFKDPGVIDAVIDFHRVRELDFAYNNKPPSFPEGLDVEVFTRSALERMMREAADPFEREHVTQFMYRRPEQFAQANFAAPTDDSDLRLTVDTEADLVVARAVYAELHRDGEIFPSSDAIRLLRRRAELAAINRSSPRSYMYRGIK